MKNPNILQHVRRPLAVIIATGALVTSVAGCRWGGGEPSSPESSATGRPYDTASPPPEPQPSTNQGQPDHTARDCHLKVQKVNAKPPIYTFQVQGRNLAADYPYSNALLMDFSDGSDPYDSSDFGVPLTTVVAHEFPARDQAHTFDVTSSVRIDGVMTPCQAPAVEVVPPAA